MGNHRADRGSSRDAASVASQASRASSSSPVGSHAGRRKAESRTTARRAERSAAVAGRRKADKHAGSPANVLRLLPSAPVLAGVATLAVAITGAVSSGGVVDAIATNTSASSQPAANALSGSGGVAQANLLSSRTQVVSRDSQRQALATATDRKLVAQAEAQVKQRNAALAAFAKKAEAQSAKLKRNAWVLPVDSYHLTARFGDYGLWSTMHTGLDFAAPSGTPIHAVAGGVVTEVGYDGAYGNKTVVTLDDGTELWYCHQTSYVVAVGDRVHSGELIGYIGDTGHTTGPHLHLEVRPGAGDPVDPYAALVAHGVTP